MNLGAVIGDDIQTAFEKIKKRKERPRMERQEDVLTVLGRDSDSCPIGVSADSCPAGAP